MSQERVLVVGGTSGLGLRIADLFLGSSAEVHVIGRDPSLLGGGLHFHKVDLCHDDLLKSFSDVTRSIDERLDVVVYVAGFYQEGKIGELMFADLEEMIGIGLLAPAGLLNVVLRKQNTLPGCIIVTSTSQWIPRKWEPVYSAVKAGLAAFARSVSLDPAVGKVLLVAPAGMKTPFWKGVGKDTSTMLDPSYVATEIYNYWSRMSGDGELHVLREPPRSEWRSLVRDDLEW